MVAGRGCDRSRRWRRARLRPWRGEGGRGAPPRGDAARCARYRRLLVLMRSATGPWPPPWPPSWSSVRDAGLCFWFISLRSGVYRPRAAGAQLKKNILDAWWRDFVELRPECVWRHAHCSPPRRARTSGHVDEFTDPLAQCNEAIIALARQTSRGHARDPRRPSPCARPRRGGGLALN